MFLGTMIVFTIGTVICASAQIFPVLLVGRLIQAVGSGLFIHIIFNTFLLILPPHRRGAVMGVVGLVIMFAPAIGPTLSGVIVEHLGRSEEHTSELQSRGHLVCRLLLEKKKTSARARSMTCEELAVRVEDVEEASL